MIAEGDFSPQMQADKDSFRWKRGEDIFSEIVQTLIVQTLY